MKWYTAIVNRLCSQVRCRIIHVCTILTCCHDGYCTNTVHVPIDWLVVLDSADTNIVIVCKFVLSHYCKMRKLRGSVQLLAQEQKKRTMI